jgi:hypothetical protein
MMRVALVLCMLAGTAFADASQPDTRATQAGDDANLESNAPRSGTTFSFSVGGGLVLGGKTSAIDSDSVGRGPSVSFRLGHVATRDTVITFEVTGGTRLHEEAVTGNTKLDHDDDYSAMAGALTYVAPSLWLRGAGGVTVFTSDDAKGTWRHAGLSGLVGIGIDFIRFHSLVLGIESWGVLSMVAARGGVFDSGLALGLTYY